ncbi:hypothetical protein BHE74_00049904, partial [Ensete ventricosum]
MKHSHAFSEANVHLFLKLRFAPNTFTPNSLYSSIFHPALSLPNIPQATGSVLGNCIPFPTTRDLSVSKRRMSPPIQTPFKLPSPLPSWPPGGEFAQGIIDLGGLEVCQVSTFTQVWATHEGGRDGLGATFFKPSTVPSGFSVLGYYAQPNNQPLFGWVLVGRDSGDGHTLAQPSDYTLVWGSQSSNINQDGRGYFWLPTPPEGYHAVGLVVTNSSEKPSVEEVRCVRSDLTDEPESDAYIWSTDGFS